METPHATRAERDSELGVVVSPSTLGPVQCVAETGRHVVSRDPSVRSSSSCAEETLKRDEVPRICARAGIPRAFLGSRPGSVEACSSITRTTPIAAEVGVRGSSIGDGSPSGAVIDVSVFRIAIALDAFLLSVVGLSMRWFGPVI